MTRPADCPVVDVGSRTIACCGHCGDVIRRRSTTSNTWRSRMGGEDCPAFGGHGPHDPDLDLPVPI